MRFTQEQENAIMATNRELLVSAAAGSGKTAVLVERILHMISDLHFSIDKMLVVTYTRAAAAELRERLENRIAEAALAKPELQKQAELASRAQISTIHAYCQKVVREHFRHCGIDPQFTLGDDRSLKALYRDSMEECLDQLYALAKEDGDAAALVKKLPEKNLTEIMETLYQFLISRPNPMEWLAQQTDKVWDIHTIDDEPLSAAFVEDGLLRLEGAMQDWAKTKAMASQPCFPQQLIQTINGDLETLNELYAAGQAGFVPLLTALRQCRFVTQARTKPTTSDEVECVERYKAIRAGYKKTIDELKKLLPDSLETAIADMNAMTPAMKGLRKAMELFFDIYRGKKLDQAMLDFNDLEHMTLSVLSNPELRALESMRFDAVFVDEYQDVSAIQEAILNGLKRPDQAQGRQCYFYVGDVKQSIYRFRLAEPQLFLEKLETFSDEPDAPCRRIILNKNFRSREAVLDAVNRTFRHVMDKRVTEITYDRSAMLYPGIDSMKDQAAELHICSSEDMKPADVVMNEARLVARDILANVGQETLDAAGQPCGRLRYQDIVILLPVVKNVADKVEAVLTAAGIPVYTDAGGNALGGEEAVQVTQHMLLLDNLMNDTALIAELRSPLFEMTEGELADIRLCAPEREASFLTAMRRTAESQDKPDLSRRCAAVLEMLAEERFLYQSMEPDKYLWDFLMRSGLYTHYGAQPGGKLRQANLRMLCKMVGEFALSHRDGLQGLLESIQGKTGGDSASPTVINPKEDVVRIMTIHKSKGLEFPTVYMMGLGGSIARRRTVKAVSMHGELGMGLMYMNERARTKRVTLVQNGIQLKLAGEERAEKARLLYVAMTRPKNRLVMIGSVKDKKNALESAVENATLKANEINDLTAVRSAGSLLDWLMQTVDSDDLIIDDVENEFSTEAAQPMEITLGRKELSIGFPQKSLPWRVVFHMALDKSTSSYFDAKVNNKFLPDLLAFAQKANEDQEKKFSSGTLFSLPELTHLPLKLGVTALCRAMDEHRAGWVQDQWEDEETPMVKRMPLLTERPRLMSAVREAPTFIQPEKENLGLLQGTATHRLLSYINLTGARQAITEDKLHIYIKEEIRRMTDNGLWKPEEAKAAAGSAVAAFLQSALGRRMLAADEVHREWSFNLKLHSPIETLVQGVIDLCFLENERWVLVDFKTDRIKTLEELWSRYCDQLGFYRLALEKATPYPVAQMGLYSLHMGQGKMQNC